MPNRNRHAMQQRTPNRSRNKAAISVVDSLRAHEKMAALMPVVMRMTAIRRDCAAVLPTFFEHCSVQKFEAGQLLLAAPNAAIATKIRQQLPKLQDALCQAGWQVSAIRLKVQVLQYSGGVPVRSKPPLPAQAVEAFAALRDSLDGATENQALKAAVSRMVRRHQSQG